VEEAPQDAGEGDASSSQTGTGRADAPSPQASDSPEEGENDSMQEEGKDEDEGGAQWIEESAPPAVRETLAETSKAEPERKIENDKKAVSAPETEAKTMPGPTPDSTPRPRESAEEELPPARDTEMESQRLKKIQFPGRPQIPSPEGKPYRPRKIDPYPYGK